MWACVIYVFMDGSSIYRWIHQKVSRASNSPVQPIEKVQLSVLHRVHHYRRITLVDQWGVLQVGKSLQRGLGFRSSSGRAGLQKVAHLRPESVTAVYTG